MASPDHDQGLLFAGLLPGREGVQCERSLRALSYIFHGWGHYKGTRPLFHGAPDNNILPIIEFEKLALFWCRIWRQLWSLKGAREQRSGRSVIDPSENQINFPPPFVLERAKHGKRPQRYSPDEGPIALADLLYELQQTEFGKRYFDIRPYRDSNGEHPSHYRTEVHVTLPEERRSHLLNGFNEIERDCIKELDDIVRRSGASELRALGTHETLVETLRDIELEFDHIVPIARGILSAIDDLARSLDLAEELLEYAEEAFKKSAGNRGDYEKAYDRFLTDCKTEFVRAAFVNSQMSAEAIWDTPQMTALAARAARARAVAQCVVAIAYFSKNPVERDNPRSRKAREIKHRWDDGIEGLKAQGLLGIPPELANIFTNGGNVRLEVREQLSQLLHGLRN